MRRAAMAAMAITGAAAIAVPVISSRSAPEAARVTASSMAPAEAADALLRRARAESEPAHAIEAERVLRAALDEEPADYASTRMLATALLAQHRFADALVVSERARRMQPADEWNDGTSGDAHLELGHYDKAFEAFDRMVTRRPTASSYARVSYALELRGDLEGAERLMRMAMTATPPSDAEAQAWHAAQLGNLLLRRGKHDEADREFRRAEHLFAGHPYARAGAIRLAVARGAYREALAMTEAEMAKDPSPELAAWAGDLSAALGDAARAAKFYTQMEALEREGWALEEPQPAALGRLLAERARKPEEALALAEQGARTRSDIHTMDAVAWAAFRAGRRDRAREAVAAAVRTGTSDQRIRAHAAAIALADGDRASARAHAVRAVEGGPYDLLAYEEARRVLRELGED